MWKILERIEIAQPPETVFDYLACFQHVAEWDPAVLTARQRTPGPPAVGSRFDVILLWGGRRIPMGYRIAALDRPRELVLEGRGSTFTAVDRIGLEAIPGGTRLTYAVTVEFARPPAKIFEMGLKAMFRIGARRTIRRLQVMLAGAGKPPRLTVMTRLADRSIFFGLPGFTRLGFYLAENCRPAASGLYTGKTMVLTGATSGIGRAAARDLYARGAHLVAVGRSAEKLDALRKELSALDGQGRIETFTADMSLMADVRQLAEALQHRYPKIDVLIHNAGALFNRREETAEGIEKTLATDLLGPYLLTRRLLLSLKAAGQARIILMASGGMYTQKIDVEDLSFSRRPYDGPAAYARAKRGLVVLCRLWAEELAPWNIRVHAMHPGWVDTPGLQKSLPAFRRWLSPLLRTPAQGADTIVWLAGAADAGNTSGGFWLDRRLHPTHVFPGTRETPEERQRLVQALEDRV
ncbi:MAG: SDR family NAD(P)-dependent oxidoreductase [Desulfobacteraceae bacterium]|jgi:NAD(P)-dependent dehydrogenase (short-subunit alcohol dehydrogenase family)|nr:SDR family NAD(P)-dependent oxidoreductase [Desulfobacteraceae bacterium]